MESRASAEAMRHILIDRARRKKTVRHGGGHRRIDFEDFDMASPSADIIHGAARFLVLTQTDSDVPVLIQKDR